MSTSLSLQSAEEEVDEALDPVGREMVSLPANDTAGARFGSKSNLTDGIQELTCTPTSGWGTAEGWDTLEKAAGPGKAIVEMTAPVGQSLETTRIRTERHK